MKTEKKENQKGYTIENREAKITILKVSFPYGRCQVIDWECTAI